MSGRQLAELAGWHQSKVERQQVLYRGDHRFRILAGYHSTARDRDLHPRVRNPRQAGAGWQAGAGVDRCSTG
ncbi:hypothetical protein OG203_23605 [Nocardia sp. NBC_01499]